MVQQIVPCLWFDGDAEDAVGFYVKLLPDSRVDRVIHSPSDNPSAPAGSVMTVECTLLGSPYVALNGGPGFPFTEAVSFQVRCDTQEEVDRIWMGFAQDGAEGQCGWIKDRWGLSWQVIPNRALELLTDPDPSRARRAMEAMLTMGKLDIATMERAADG